MKWDIFISHASEDKEKFVKPLAEALISKGLKVWYDDFTLNIGDSLRESIDEGLKNSRYGLVILSQDFFKKEWTKKEFNALVNKETCGTKVILPIWYNVSYSDVSNFSPMLSDTIAIKASIGIEHIVEKIHNICFPAEGAINYSTLNILTHEIHYNEKLIYNKSYGFIKEGRTYFSPFDIALACGIYKEHIFFSEDGEEVIIKNGNTKITVKNNCEYLKVNDTQIQMNNPAFVDDFQNEKILYIPPSYLALALGKQITFDSKTYSLVFTDFR